MKTNCINIPEPAKNVFVNRHNILWVAYLEHFLKHHPRLRYFADRDFIDEQCLVKMSVRNWKKFCNEYGLRFKEL